MDYLLSKIKGNDNDYYRVLSNVTIFEMNYDFNRTRPYADDYKLEEEEWFVIDEFTEKDYCLQFLREEFIGVESPYKYISREDYKNIDYIISIQSENYYLFQKVTKSYVYKRHRMISWSDQAILINAEDLLIIKELPDCIFDKKANKLYFKNLSSITSIFIGINILYREATDNEVEEFLSLDIVNVAPQFSKEQVKTANRRRIKEAMKRYEDFTIQQRNKIPDYISKYCLNIYDSATNKFNISNEKELTELLNTLNQRYYTTEIDGEKRLANSVVKL